MIDLKALGLGLAAFFFIAAGVVAQVLAATVTLKPDAIVSGDSIALGHLFDGIQADGDAVIGRAPRPGHSLVLDAVTLKRLASRHNVAWAPRDTTETITITRATREIDGISIENALTDALADRLLSSGFEIELGGAWPTLMAPAEAEDAPVLIDLKLDDRSGRFSALLAATRNAPLGEQLKIVGRVIRTESIPVPARAIGAGEIIAEADLDWRTLRTDRLGQDPVVSADAIIGKAARRALKPGAPVRGGDLLMPLVIEKGTPVTMTYSVPGMHLTMQGRALEGGALGQSIRVQNPISKMILFGKVTTAGTVEVAPAAGHGEFALGANEGGIQ